jgi:hypothetical protein
VDYYGVFDEDTNAYTLVPQSSLESDITKITNVRKVSDDVNRINSAKKKNNIQFVKIEHVIPTVKNPSKIRPTSRAIVVATFLINRQEQTLYCWPSQIPYGRQHVAKWWSENRLPTVLDNDAKVDFPKQRIEVVVCCGCKQLDHK